MNLHTRIGRLAGRSLGACVGGTAALATYGYSTDEGFRRLVDFNRLVIPIACHYKFVEITGGTDDAFERLHETYANRVLEIVLEMKGYYVKLAQFASSFTAALPKQYVERLRTLQDEAPHKDMSIVRGIIEDELNTTMDDVFSEFDPEPLGAASIGQVHRAVLRENGAEVVVKVQYPEAERNFLIDMDLFRRACRVFSPGFVGVLEQVQSTFKNEFDYIAEASLQQQAFRAIASVEKRSSFDTQWSDTVIVPRAYLSDHPKLPARFRPASSSKCAFAEEADRSSWALKFCPYESKIREGRAKLENSGFQATEDAGPRNGLCTKRLLVMDRLKGKSVAKWGREHLEMIALQHGFANREALEDALKQIDPRDARKRFGNPPNRWLLSGYSKSLDVRDFVWNKLIAMPVNVCSTLCKGGAILTSYDTAKRHRDAVDIYAARDAMFGAYGWLMFRHGIVNGDSHPGNVMLLEDGKVGLIDWGQTRILADVDIPRIAQVVCAVAARDEVMSARLMQDIGFLTQRQDPWVLNRLAALHWGEYSEYSVGSANDGKLGGVMKVADNFEILDPCQQFYETNGDIFIAARGCICLRLTAQNFGFFGLNSAIQVEAAARAALRERGIDPGVVPNRRLPDSAEPDWTKFSLRT